MTEEVIETGTPDFRRAARALADLVAAIEERDSQKGPRRMDFEELWNRYMQGTPDAYAARGWNMTRLLRDLSGQVSGSAAADIANVIAAEFEARGYPMTRTKGSPPMVITVDAMPMMADVISGAMPRPVMRQPGENGTTWAANTAAIRRLSHQWGASSLVADPDAGEVGRDLIAALGEPLAGGMMTLTDLGGRLVALNEDGTRAAFYDLSDLDSLTLTTAHAASSYGIPVLVIDDMAYGPGDMTPLGATGAALLRSWAALFLGERL